MSKILIAFILVWASINLQAQELLKLSDAVKILLENDYNIKVAENNSQVAQNNSSVYNNGFLPQVNARGGAAYSQQNVNSSYYDGTSTKLDGATTTTYNTSVGISYTLFDGMYRSYNFEKSKELYALSKLQVRQIIENSFVELFSAYYTVANLTETTNSLKQTLEISKERMLRTTYGVEYGTVTQLDLLNAQVDVNADSINVLNSVQNLENAKRNLNLIMGREITYNFEIDTMVSYNPVQPIDSIMALAKIENINLITAQKNLQLSAYDIKLLKTNWIPTLGLSGSYGYANINNNERFLLENQTSLGPKVELSLSWNIFDGGRTRVGLQNAKIATETKTVQLDQTRKQVERNVINAFTSYQNSLFVLQAEKENLVTSKRNFDRSEEQYRLGQLTSVEFRQAQLNFLHAQTSHNQAKYQAKVYELALFKLTGQLMQIKF